MSGGCALVDYTSLIAKAAQVKKHAYAPYSHFCVGAALLCDDTSVFTGVNIENVSYGATNCAERTAIFKAVSEGKRNFSAIAVVSDMDSFIYPCGICRQVLAEFRVPIVVVGNKEGNYKVYSTETLLPNAFTDFDSRKNQGK
ncbi:MAG TPA: cytidine deaminase [Clostridiales bacterium]|nr:cytidine deaminase [Clostridiales bacterium]